MATAETAGEIMRPDPVTVQPGTAVAEAARLMDRHEVTCLPVTDESGKLLGVVGPRNLHAIDDTIPRPAPDRDELPLPRGPHPPVASRRLT